MNNKRNNTRKALFIGALVASANVAAQSSVTLYGAVDDAVAYANNQKGRANMYLRQGNLAASKWGLRGVEDLGGGLAAVFDLQAGFDLNSGAASSSGLFFNRQAYVGMRSNALGTVTLGRQYTPYLLFISPLASSSWLTGATGAHPGDIDGLDTTIRVNNSVTYTSPSFAGLQGSAMYAVGGFAGNLGKGQTLSAALSYSVGAVSLAAGYLRMDNAGTNGAPGFDSTSTASFGTSALNQGYISARSVRHVAGAGTYTFGSATVGLSYSNVRYLPGGLSPFESTAVFNTYGAIGVYRFTSFFDVAGAYSYTVASKANGVTQAARYQQYSLKEVYHLSKRTTIYALQAWQHSSGNTLGAKGNVVDASPSVGDSQNATPASIRGQFVGMLGMTVLF